MLSNFKKKGIIRKERGRISPREKSPRQNFAQRKTDETSAVKHFAAAEELLGNLSAISTLLHRTYFVSDGNEVVG
jgi:hypothetical protein